MLQVEVCVLGYPPGFPAVPRYLNHTPVRPRRRVEARLTACLPHKSVPADFPHTPFQPLVHSTASDCIRLYGTYSLGRRNGK
jgi:hypothetical protein